MDLNYLTEGERDAILAVLRRDDALRRQEQQRIAKIKQEIHYLRLKSVVRPGEDPGLTCARCRTQLGRIFNRGAECPKCRHRVCDNCHHNKGGGDSGWLCTLCLKQLELEVQSGAWIKRYGPPQSLPNKDITPTDMIKASIKRGSGRPSLSRFDSGGEESDASSRFPKTSDEQRLNELLGNHTDARRVGSNPYDSDSSSTDEDGNSDGPARPAPTPKRRDVEEDSLRRGVLEKSAMAAEGSPKLSRDVWHNRTAGGSPDHSDSEGDRRRSPASVERSGRAGDAVEAGVTVTVQEPSPGPSPNTPRKHNLENNNLGAQDGEEDYDVEEVTKVKFRRVSVRSKQPPVDTSRTESGQDEDAAAIPRYRRQQERAPPSPATASSRPSPLKGASAAEASPPPRPGAAVRRNDSGSFRSLTESDMEPLSVTTEFSDHSTMMSTSFGSDGSPTISPPRIERFDSSAARPSSLNPNVVLVSNPTRSPSNPNVLLRSAGMVSPTPDAERDEESPDEAQDPMLMARSYAAMMAGGKESEDKVSSYRERFRKARTTGNSSSDDGAAIKDKKVRARSRDKLKAKKQQKRDSPERSKKEQKRGVAGMSPGKERDARKDERVKEKEVEKTASREGLYLKKEQAGQSAKKHKAAKPRELPRRDTFEDMYQKNLEMISSSCAEEEMEDMLSEDLPTITVEDATVLSATVAKGGQKAAHESRSSRSHQPPEKKKSDKLEKKKSDKAKVPEKKKSDKAKVTEKKKGKAAVSPVVRDVRTAPEEEGEGKNETLVAHRQHLHRVQARRRSEDEVSDDMNPMLAEVMRRSEEIRRSLRKKEEGEKVVKKEKVEKKEESVDRTSIRVRSEEKKPEKVELRGGQRREERVDKVSMISDRSSVASDISAASSRLGSVDSLHHADPHYTPRTERALMKLDNALEDYTTATESELTDYDDMSLPRRRLANVPSIDLPVETNLRYLEGPLSPITVPDDDDGEGSDIDVLVQSAQVAAAARYKEEEQREVRERMFVPIEDTNEGRGEREMASERAEAVLLDEGSATPTRSPVNVPAVVADDVLDRVEIRETRINRPPCDSDNSAALSVISEISEPDEHTLSVVRGDVSRSRLTPPRAAAVANEPVAPPEGFRDVSEVGEDAPPPLPASPPPLPRAEAGVATPPAKPPRKSRRVKERKHDLDSLATAATRHMTSSFSEDVEAPAPEYRESGIDVGVNLKAHEESILLARRGEEAVGGRTSGDGSAAAAASLYTSARANPGVSATSGGREGELDAGPAGEPGSGKIGDSFRKTKQKFKKLFSRSSEEDDAGVIKIHKKRESTKSSSLEGLRSPIDMLASASLFLSDSGSKLQGQPPSRDDAAPEPGASGGVTSPVLPGEGEELVGDSSSPASVLAFGGEGSAMGRKPSVLARVSSREGVSSLFKVGVQVAATPLDSPAVGAGDGESEPQREETLEVPELSWPSRPRRDSRVMLGMESSDEEVDENQKVSHTDVRHQRASVPVLFTVKEKEGDPEIKREGSELKHTRSLGSFEVSSRSAGADFPRRKSLGMADVVLTVAPAAPVAPVAPLVFEKCKPQTKPSGGRQASPSPPLSPLSGKDFTEASPSPSVSSPSDSGSDGERLPSIAAALNQGQHSKHGADPEPLDLGVSASLSPVGSGGGSLWAGDDSGDEDESGTLGPFANPLFARHDFNSPDEFSDVDVHVGSDVASVIKTDVSLHPSDVTANPSAITTNLDDVTTVTPARASDLSVGGDGDVTSASLSIPVLAPPPRGGGGVDSYPSVCSSDHESSDAAASSSPRSEASRFSAAGGEEEKGGGTPVEVVVHEPEEEERGGMARVPEKDTSPPPRNVIPKGLKLKDEEDPSQDIARLQAGGGGGGAVLPPGGDPGRPRLPSLGSTHSRGSEASNDPDIDEIFLREKQERGKMDQLNPKLSMSMESIHSYYSMAEDNEAAYNKVPVSGTVQLSLNYNAKPGVLEIMVAGCSDLAAVDAKRSRSDPYVKMYLLPDRSRGGKRKTHVKKHTLSPTYNETLKYTITRGELENRTLWVSVWHSDRLGHNIFLGEVTIPLDNPSAWQSPEARIYTLRDRQQMTMSNPSYKGELMVSLKFVPPKETDASKKKKGKSSRRSGQLHCMVKEARNLTATKNAGADPFVKGYLLPDKKVKQKTGTVKNNCNPAWNAELVWEGVDLEELGDRCLELTVWDHDIFTTNEFLGGVRCNLGNGRSRHKPVDWMNAEGNEVEVWQNMLTRPGHWVDATLLLRSNMHRHK